MPGLDLLRAGRFEPTLEQAGAAASCIYLIAALVVAALLYVAVERPGLRLRDRFLTAARRHSVVQPA